MTINEIGNVGYRQVEYIQSDGTQYADTGFVVNKSDTCILTIIAEFSNDAYGGANGYMQFMSGIAQTKSTIKIVYDGETCIETVYVNGEVDSTTDWSSSFDGTNVKIGLFRLGNTDDTWWTNGDAQIGKLYSASLEKSGTIVRDFVPCVTSDGTAGIYDLVDGQFYGNSGTGVFTAGPTLEQVEYIESSGTQYIDTAVIPDAGTKVILDFQLTSAGTENQCIFGVVGQFSFRWYGSNSCFRSNGGNNVDFDTAIVSTDRHTVVKETLTCTIDDTYTVTTTAGTVSKSLFVFAQNNTSVNNYASMKLFSMKLFSGDTLIRDFIPCLKSDGTVCLYDRVSRTTFDNAGSGTFTAGLYLGVSKVVFGEDVLIDLTEDTVTAETLSKGVTAHDKAGRAIVGSLTGADYMVATLTTKQVTSIPNAFKNKMNGKTIKVYGLIHTTTSNNSIPSGVFFKGTNAIKINGTSPFELDMTCTETESDITIKLVRSSGTTTDNYGYYLYASKLYNIADDTLVLVKE